MAIYTDTFSSLDYALWWNSGCNASGGNLLGGTGAFASYFGAAFQANHYSRGYAMSGVTQIRVLVRVSYAGSSSWTGYMGSLTYQGPNVWLKQILRYPGAATLYSNTHNGAFGAGDYLEVQANGSTISMNINGGAAIATANDSNYAYGHPGLAPLTGNNGFASWQGADISGSYESLTFLDLGSSIDLGTFTIGGDMTPPGGSYIPITKNGGGTLTYSCSSGITWLTIPSPDGSVTVERPCGGANVGIALNSSGMSAGDYEGDVTVSTNAGSDTKHYMITFVSGQPKVYPFVSSKPSY